MPGMSRGRTGIIKALKEVFREVKFFGDAEIATLKKNLESHKLQLEQLKARRAEQARREEQLALLEMRKAVEQLQHMQAVLEEQDQRMEAVVEELGQRAMAQQEREMMSRAMGVMETVKMEDLVTTSDEAQLQKELDRLQAELQAVGKGGGTTPAPAAPIGRPQKPAGTRKRR